MIDKVFLFQYIRQLAQLVLSPMSGWEDISAAVHNPDELVRRGFIPFLGITGLSEFIPLLYSPSRGIVTSILCAFVICVGMFSSLYVARLFLEMTYGRYIDRNINQVKLNLFITYMIGLNCVYSIITNAFPASMTLLKLLPLLSVIVIFRSTTFLGVSENNQLSFTGLAIIAVIACPIAICGVLMLLV